MSESKTPWLHRAFAAVGWRRDAYRHTLTLALLTAGFVALGKTVLWPLDAALALLPAAAPVSIDSFLIAGSAVLGVVQPTRSVPVTLVEIDEALYAQWGRPCVTPRDQLARLIALAAAEHPQAIVVDVNLDCTTAPACSPGSTCDLATFFAAYRGPPLILVRGTYFETPANDPPRVRSSRTAYEDAVGGNPNILWAHTLYLTDADGVVRRWRDAWEVCTDSGTETVLAVPLRVTAAVTHPSSSPEAPPRSGQCTLAAQTSPQHLLIFGAPIAGQNRLDASADTPRTISARLLLDAGREVERGGYFSLTDRVVLIGATHAASGDLWRTPIGLMPGIELIAHTLRFAPPQTELRDGAEYSKPITLVALWILAALAFLLRPAVVVLITGVASLVAIYVATGVFSRFDIFASLALSLALFVEYAVAYALWELVAETKNYRRWRIFRALLAKRMRADDPEAQ